MNGTMTLLPLYTFTAQTGTLMHLLYKFNFGSCHQSTSRQQFAMPESLSKK